MITEKAIYHRAERLMGPHAMTRLSACRVIIFGVGGVGSWCAEGLVRSGITHLTLVDSDCVCASNVNRQLMATTRTVGMVKVEALRERLLTINPNAQIEAVQEIYSEQTAGSFGLEGYNFVVDAIDSLAHKAHLIHHVTSLKGPTLLSSMGAALKMDPTKVQVAEFRKVRGCPLARALRQRFKRNGAPPRRKFRCVFSDEVLPNLGPDVPCPTCEEAEVQSHDGQGRPDLRHHEWDSSKARVNGTVAHVTAIFGFTLAGLIVQDVYNAARMATLSE